jgi:HK97 family phage major capsid protein
MTTNLMKIPAIDETSRADGSRWGGTRGYWMNEADALTGSKPRFKNLELTAKKVGVLTYATSELFNDMSALSQYLIGNRGVMAKELAWKITDAAINGDGAGKPQGVLNSPSLVVVTRSGSNVVAANDVLNMLARFWVGSRTDPQGLSLDANMSAGPKPAWFCHSDVVAQLATCVIAVGSGGSLAFLYNPETMNLMGFPVVPIEQCQALGTQGDLILADMNEYLLATRNSNLDVSMHVRFLNDEQAIRLIIRMDGQPAWNSAVTPFNGTNTQSPFVVLHA